jgi:DNA adenine methylase
VEPTRPILRYHGGKWRLAPWIISHFPPHRVYVEPFGGAASVLLRKPRSYAEVYNDLDGEIVNLFRVLRDESTAARLEELVRLTPFARVEFAASYEPAADPIEQARRTLIRSFMGFGSSALTRKSGFRADAKRSGTTPAKDWAGYPEALSAIIERLRGVIIENRDARQIMATHDGPDTLHYVDPPYVFSTRNTGSPNRNYDYRHEMTDADHIALAEFLHGLRGMVIVSGYDCPLYAEMYRGWRTDKKQTLADGARAREETLWLSPNIGGMCGNLFNSA